LESEKIRVTVLSPLRTTGRKLYVSLDPKISQVFDLKIGDILKLELVSVFRKPKEES
jgi:hypothetical protein